MTGEAMPADKDTEDVEVKTKTLEQRYIELLEEKIARLETEFNNQLKELKELKEKSEAQSTSPNKAETSSSKQEESAKEENKPSEPEKKPRSRYVERRLNDDGEWVEKEVKEKEPEPEEATAKKDEYAITWRRNFDNSSSFGQVRTTNELLIHSHVLRMALMKVVKNYDNISFETNEVIISEPYECIYHNRRQLAKYAAESTTDEATRTDLNVLLTDLAKEQETAREDAKSLGEKGMTKFELLWTLFFPGCLVFATPILGQPQVFMVNQVSFDKNDCSFWAYSMDYNGSEFGRLEVQFHIDHFKGTKSISSLSAYPLEWHRDADGNDNTVELKKLLIARGRKFEKLCTAKRTQKHFRYSGVIVDEGQDIMLTDFGNSGGEGTGAASALSHSLSRFVKREKLPDDSYVMVDYEAFVEFGGKSITVGNQSTNPSSNCQCAFCMNGRQEWDGVSPTNKNPEKRRLSEKQLLLCPPRVVGFAMKSKVWVQMLVDNVEELKTEGKDNAFKKLELPKRTKDLLRDLVEQHTKFPNRLDDLVPGKGNGLIALLHGPPGVGKTLTAESVAILTGKPLYCISMSDVGMSPAIVETNLIRIFDLAVHWQAILLFDEADVFLESRSLQDLRRNGLVSVLLRVLEYYHGILFLTTNRVKTFDEAFQSRVHIAVKYEELQVREREAIWNMWLDQLDEGIANVRDIKEMVQEDLAAAPLNGRQIRNIITSAQAVARAQNPYGRLEYRHINQVTKVTTEFQNYLAQSNELAKAQNLR